MDKPIPDEQVHDVQSEAPSPENTVNNNSLDSEDPEYAVDYGLSLGSHHHPLNHGKTHNYIDHVPEPVNNTYI